MGDEGVVLTDREREALAGLAESIGDPWLARQLVGQDQAPPPPKRRLASRATALRQATAGWIGLLFLVIGAAVVVATFVRSTVVASLGLAIMGFGAWRIAADHGETLIRRWTARRTPPAGPQPPRRRPGAA